MQVRGGFAVLDFGSQFTQLIARRLRELHVYSELFPYDVSFEKLKAFQPRGIILSGGPSSVIENGAPTRDVKALMELAPVMGICYGMQLLAHQLGGRVEPAGRREYGLNRVTWNSPVAGVPASQNVWMSHGDVVEKLPAGFEEIARSEREGMAAMRGPGVLALQFHPEVTHTEHGLELLKHFVFEMCRAEANWRPESIVTRLTQEVQAKIPAGEKILCALSGGVDSTVVGTLLTRALGAERVQCIFLNNGLLRKNEFENVQKIYQGLGLNVRAIDASREFLTELADVEDPEKKRKIIGRVFLEVFEKSVDLSQVQWLAQGTLYPDVIESVNIRGSSVTIKSHHNVGGLPEKMRLKLVEPLRELFKDEVREIGAQLGIPHDVLWRHPFPGPGLAIRIIGAVNEKDLKILRDCDDIFISELRAKGLYEKIWQAFCVLLPVKTVGVQGDSRSYERVLALRAVTSRDGMTADWYSFDGEFLRVLSNKITNHVRGVNRVVYDISSKPPATIEWE